MVFQSLLGTVMTNGQCTQDKACDMMQLFREHASTCLERALPHTCISEKTMRSSAVSSSMSVCLSNPASMQVRCHHGACEARGAVKHVNKTARAWSCISQGSSSWRWFCCGLDAQSGRMGAFQRRAVHEEEVGPRVRQHRRPELLQRVPVLTKIWVWSGV